MNRTPKTIREAFMEASSFLRENGVELAKEHAEQLLLHSLGESWTRTKMLTEWNEPFPDSVTPLLEELLKRRANGEPLQYLLGNQEFYGLTFTVGKGVLIPRPETELLIQHLFEVVEQLGFREDEEITVADIGTGSGAIAVTIAVARPKWKVYAVDLSPDALERARSNARLHGVETSIEWRHGHLTTPLLEEGIRLDLLVSNPPYIPSREMEGLQKEVLHEPRLALDGGEDGLDCYTEISSSIPRLLKPKSIIAYEVGIDQSEAVAELLRLNGMDRTSIYPDYQGIPRVVIGYSMNLANQ